MPNLMDFYKGVFLYVIPVRIIVPCFYIRTKLRLKNGGTTVYLLERKASLSFLYDFKEEIYGKLNKSISESLH